MSNYWDLNQSDSEDDTRPILTSRSPSRQPMPSTPLPLEQHAEPGRLQVDTASKAILSAATSSPPAKRAKTDGSEDDGAQQQLWCRHCAKSYVYIKSLRKHEARCKTVVEAAEAAIAPGVAAVASTCAAAIGDRVVIFWPAEHTHFAGVIAKCAKKRHLVQYDDGDERWHDLSKERWRKETPGHHSEPHVARANSSAVERPHCSSTPASTTSSVASTLPLPARRRVVSAGAIASTAHDGYSPNGVVSAAELAAGMAGVTSLLKQARLEQYAVSGGVPVASSG